jgi:hypothetical protein
MYSIFHIDFAPLILIFPESNLQSLRMTAYERLIAPCSILKPCMELLRSLKSYLYSLLKYLIFNAKKTLIQLAAGIAASSDNL